MIVEFNGGNSDIMYAMIAICAIIARLRKRRQAKLPNREHKLGMALFHSVDSTNIHTPQDIRKLAGVVMNG